MKGKFYDFNNLLGLWLMFFFSRNKTVNCSTGSVKLKISKCYIT